MKHHEDVELLLKDIAELGYPHHPNFLSARTLSEHDVLVVRARAILMDMPKLPKEVSVHIKRAVDMMWESRKK